MCPRRTTLPARVAACPTRPGGTLAITERELVVKRYAIGDEHAEHQDLYGGAARRKLGGIVQLSARRSTRAVRSASGSPTSRSSCPAQGILAVWPGWTLHRSRRSSRANGGRWPCSATDRRCGERTTARSERASARSVRTAAVATESLFCWLARSARAVALARGFHRLALSGSCP